MNCEICFNKFNSSSHKPITLMPCGHTFCSACLANIRRHYLYCPNCREEINNERPNYTVLNIINYNPAQDVNLKLKQKIQQNMKDVDEAQRRYYSNYEKKLDDTKERFGLVKRKINLKTTELMNLLLTFQENLLNKVDDLENRFNNESINSFHAFDDLVQKLDSVKSKYKDLHRLDQIELNNLKYELELRKNDMDIITNELEYLTCRAEFKESTGIIGENLVGEIRVPLSPLPFTSNKSSSNEPDMLDAPTTSNIPVNSNFQIKQISIVPALPAIVAPATRIEPLPAPIRPSIAVPNSTTVPATAAIPATTAVPATAPVPAPAVPAPAAPTKETIKIIRTKSTLNLNQRQMSKSPNRSRLNPGVRVKIFSANHNHEFKIIKSEDAWICDGKKIFGECKSKIDQCGRSHGKIRYRCTVCPDFDLCHLCLHEPKVEKNQFNAVRSNSYRR